MDRDREAFEAWCKDIVGVARDLDAACERLAAGRSQNAYDAMIEGGQANDLLALDRARKAVREVIAAPMPPAPAALAYVRGEREGWKTGLEEVGTTDRGYTIYRQVNEVGGHRYWSDEIGGGVVAWDTCLVDAGTLHECLRIEKRAHALSELAAADGELLSPATAEDVRRASERQAEFDAGRPSARVMIGVDPACEPSSAVWFCPTCKKSGEIPPPEEKE